MIGIDFTWVPPNGTGGTPYPGMSSGRWWLMTRDSLIHAGAVRDYARELASNVPTPGIMRIGLADTELVEPGEVDEVLARHLELFRRYSQTDSIIIGNFWPGLPYGQSYQTTVNALEGRDRAARTAMYELARAQVPIIQLAGVATQLFVVDTREQFPFFARKTELLAGFMRSAFPGSMRCAFVTGCYVREPGTPPFTDEHAALAAMVIANNYEMVAVYGTRAESGGLAAALSRLILPSNPPVAAVARVMLGPILYGPEHPKAAQQIEQLASRRFAR